MGAVSIVVDAREIADLATALQRLATASLGPVMERVAAAGEEATRERIAAGGPAPDGSDWPERDARDPNPHPLLNRDGGLLDSITGEHTDDTAAWGSHLVYSRIHQLGGTVEPVDKQVLRWESGGEVIFAAQVEIPARPYLGIGDAERALILELVEDWVTQQLGTPA